MTKQQLEHVLRAAAAITGTDQFILVGSQSILGSDPNAPEELTVSNEIDIFSLQDEDVANLIDGSIGEKSTFHDTFGYYAHGVHITTATLPDGWKDRLIPFSSPATRGSVGHCIEANDLAVSKLAAGRDKDLTFVAALFRHKLADPQLVEQRIGLTSLVPELRQGVLTRLGIAIRNAKQP